MDSNPKYRHSNVPIFPNIHLTKVPLGLTHTLVQLPPPFCGSREFYVCLSRFTEHFQEAHGSVRSARYMRLSGSGA